MTDETAATNAAEAPIAPAQVAESAPAGEAPPKEDGFTRRIDELTRSWRDEERSRQQVERDRDYWREQAMRTQQPTPKPEDDKTKTLADFEYDDAKYQTYLFDRAEQRAVKAAEARIREEQAKNRGEERRQTFLRKASEFEKTKPDFWDKARLLPQFSNETMEDISGLESSAEVVYFLANNPSTANEIARLPAREAARELGRIEARLGFEREKLAAAAKVSKTPEPPPKVDGAGDPGVGVSVTSPESDTLSDAEWNRRRTLQIEKRRKAT